MDQSPRQMVAVSLHMRMYESWKNRRGDGKKEKKGNQWMEKKETM